MKRTTCKAQPATGCDHPALEDQQSSCATCTVLGKVEGTGKLWHGHVTAVSVASDCRRLGLATKLMNILEKTTDNVYAS
jgi:N-terminal acetyltransferase B complex catalytic subunit